MSDEKNINNREYLDIIQPEYIEQPWINALKIDPLIEVRQRDSEASWSIDTSDSSIEKVDYFFNLNAPNPDWQLFSLWVDWNIFAFKIWFFNNSNLAYLQLTSSLQIKLWSSYIVNYIWGTVIRISKVDWTTISVSNPWRTKQFVLSSFDSDSIIRVTIDWVNYDLDWNTHWGNWNTALTWLNSQLPLSTYYTIVSWLTFVILRQDWWIVSISKTQYDRYTYDISWRSSLINPSSTNVWWSWWINEIKEYRINVWIDWNNQQYTLSSWLTFSPISVIIPFSNCSWITPSQNDDNGNTHWTKAIDMLYWIIPGSYIKSSLNSFTTSWVEFWGYQFSLRKTDYSLISISESIEYVKDTSLALHTINNSWLIVSQINHKADITISNYTEILITLTVFSYNLYIPISFNFKTIIMTAVSSVWSSDNWIYDSTTWEQSCTSKYSSTTSFVSWKIFQTWASDYGNIVRVEKFWQKRGFILSCSLTVSNKLDYICKV